MKLHYSPYIIGIFLSFLFVSCLKDDDNDTSRLYPNALVTAKHAGNTFYLQLDDSTTLLPVNLSNSPFGKKEVRALVNYKKTDDPHIGYSEAVHVNWIDSLLTKNIAPNLGAQNNSIYGTDPVEIVRDWVTLVEDGFLTLRFRTVWGSTRVIHKVNLISTNNPDDPYEVAFYHNAQGDTYGQMRDALVAFNLDELPDTQGKTVKLTLKWTSFNGGKSTQFDYRTRE
ncbi:MAG: NigD-like protein [Capnocytophaga sp.]|nr:NigD-like protein [Capnocytophaga sp.]